MDKATLKKMKKKELINKVLEQNDIIEKQKIELEQAQKTLQDRCIKLQKSGTIAEAAFQLNGVFEAAEKAAAQYLENIERLSGEQESVMKRQQAEHERKMQELYTETKDKCEALKLKTQKECEDMVMDAENQVQDRWSTLELKWDTFCTAHDDMKNVLKLLKKEDLSGMKIE